MVFETGNHDNHIYHAGLAFLLLQKQYMLNLQNRDGTVILQCPWYSHAVLSYEALLYVSINAAQPDTLINVRPP